MEDLNEGTYFRKNIWWRETYRPVLAGPVDGRALYFTMPLLLWPMWPETPLVIFTVLFVFWLLASKKIEPDNVHRILISYSVGRRRPPVSKYELRAPKDFAFETPEVMETEREAFRDALEKHEKEHGPAMLPDDEIAPRKLHVHRCVMG